MDHTALMTLSDDGTMDTVVLCDNCGQEYRYTYLGSPDTASEEWDSAYEDFVNWALSDAGKRHESEPPYPRRGSHLKYDDEFPEARDDRCGDSMCPVCGTRFPQVSGT